MIDYLEIRDENLKSLAPLGSAKSIIWRTAFFGTGDFEIYVTANSTTLSLLQVGRYVTRPDGTDPTSKAVGIIESIAVSDNVQDGTMLTATGRLAKSILDRRLIYKLSGKTNTPTILRGNVEEKVRQTVLDNAISCSFDSRRNMPQLELGALAGIPLRIVDKNGYATQKQVSGEILLTYTDSVLAEYALGSDVRYNDEVGKLQYIVLQGADRSADNVDGNTPVIFSRDFSNLISSEYRYDTTAEKNAALIGGEGQGVERFFSELSGDESGMQRREMWIDASSIAKAYTENEVEKTYTDEEYKAMLDAKGKQDLAPLVASETFAGALDATNGRYKLNRDFSLGDIVTVQDSTLGKYINVQISETLETQDDNGYNVEISYI